MKRRLLDCHETSGGAIHEDHRLPEEYGSRSEARFPYGEIDTFGAIPLEIIAAAQASCQMQQ